MTTLDAQRQRAAKQQSVYREVNERIGNLAGAESSADFVCECLQQECDERVSLALEDYEQIRSSPNRFFVVAGHESPEVEAVVARHDRYLIVELLGAGAAVA